MTAKNDRAPLAVIQSFWGDTFVLHLVPIITIGLLVFHWPWLSVAGHPDRFAPVLLIKFLDWGHIFAQWVRIRTNPLEDTQAFKRYLLLWLCMFLFFIPLLFFTGHEIADTALIYFVIFHFSKQQYGYLRYMSRSEYQAYPKMQKLEDAYFYVGIIAPILGWHAHPPGAIRGSYWITHFLKAPWLSDAAVAVWVAYAILALAYWSLQARLLWRRGVVPVPKYLVLLFAHAGWGAISLFPDKGMLYWLGVVLYHDLSYFMFIWWVARRDQKLGDRPTFKWYSWKSCFGLFGYILGTSFLADLVLHVYLSLSHGRFVKTFFSLVVPNSLTGALARLYEELMSSVDKSWLAIVGLSIFFSIQAHHYFIDRYLWKKEKDLAWQMRRRKS